MAEFTDYGRELVEQGRREAALWQRDAFLDSELHAVGYGSLIGAVTEDEWYERASFLLKLKARLA